MSINRCTGLLFGAALTASALTGVVSPAVAATPESAQRAVVRVTIVAEGTDLSGTVTSRRPGCVTDRTVVVYRQVGSRGGGDDERFGSDTTFVDDSGRATWSLGNSGTEGRFYAVVRGNSQCRAAASATVLATR